ncbi:MAG TPA: polymer-forming cytoskeletal protein [Pyrinomonadaceae bacterium]|jgi:cytoskeletal protein CcmA (bactofilin family)|nr:polymer-forming cytoskeletal protein [Pyrinomonadaceae bacterium]
MNTLYETAEPGNATNSLVAPDPFDVSKPFSRWLDDLQAARHPLAHQTPAAEEDEASEIYIGSFPGSNCELSFEGVLHFDGYSFGPITSPEGTLVLTHRGRIEADVDVRVAIINGWVTGNITATDRVVLDSEARVTGQIFTRALSVKLGAVFDGECLLTVPEYSFGTAGSPRPGRSSAYELAVAAGA